MASQNYRRISSRQQSAVARRYLLSGFTDHEKAQLAVDIINLGSRYLEMAEYTSECSHVVTAKPMRSEKYLCACAAGKWLLTPAYIKDSAKAGHWLKEEQYQWGIHNVNTPIGQTSMARAPARWHRTVQETGRKAFEGWKVAIFVENKRRKPAVYKRVVECGGGKVIIVKTPIKDADSLATQLTHALADPTYEAEVMNTLSVRGIPCVMPDYIAEHLFEEEPDIAKFLITKRSQHEGRCQSIITSGISSQQSSRRSSRTASVNNSPLKVKQEQSCVATPTSTTTTKAISAAASEIAQFPRPARTTRSSKAIDQSTARTTRGSKVIKQHNPSAVKLNHGVATRAVKAEPVMETADFRTPVKPATTSHTSITPVGEAPRVPIPIDLVKDVAETVLKQQAESPFSIVPYWMQVTRPKRKHSEDSVALPFPKVVCNFIEACVEEGLWVDAVATITTNLTVSKFPPPDILHIVMMEIMKSDSSTLASTGYHMLKSVLCLHSPMTSPSMGQIYLQSMLPPNKYIEGFELEEDTPIRCYWDFMDRVIRNSLQRLTPVEPLSKDEEYKESKTQLNNQLMLNYLISLLEQDFKGTKARHVAAKKTSTPLPHCMLASILWPTGQRKVNSKVLQALLEHFASAVKQTKDHEDMCIVLRLLATLVSMSSELLCSTHPSAFTTQDGVFTVLAYELVSIVRQADLLDNVDSIHIMLTTLEPSWLKLRVTEILLQEYDDCLVLPQFKNKEATTQMLTLEKMVNYHFYLLPAGSETTSSPSPPSKKCITSPLKKTTRNPRMVNALQTIGDSNHTAKEVPGQKRNIDSVAGSKVICTPSKKRKVMLINKRNAKGETQLHVACIKNDITKLRQLLSSPGIQVNMTDYAGWTPLHESCNHGHVGCVKELLKFKPKPNIMAFLDKDSKKAYGGIDLLASPVECGTTPLHDAVQNGHIDIVRLLVKGGGKSVLMAKNKAGLTPPDLAIVDVMKEALHLEGVVKGQQQEMSQCGTGERLHDEPLSESNLTKSAEDTSSKVKDGCSSAVSSSGPSEELYATVLGSPQKPKRFITAPQVEKYCMLVRHLFRAYVQYHKLADIKIEVDRRLAREKKQRPQLNVSTDENSNLFFSPVGVATLPLVRLRNLDRKSDQQSIVHKAAATDKTLAEDLDILNNIDNHITGFINHIGRIGPWVGPVDSSICKGIFLELNLLTASWGSEW